MREKKFIISIDTEGDNLWDWSTGKPITTNNAKYLPRFQNLCEKYGFKPTYLTNYEMANDPFFIETFSKAREENRCEIGMHLHAFFSPPDEYCLTERSDCAGKQAYLIEFPPEVMEAKISFMTDLIAKRFGIRPISHRAGRWAMNDVYFRLLDRYGFLVDCSVTPGVNWKSHIGFSSESGGSDYTKSRTKPYCVPGTELLELPMTIVKDHRYYHPERFGLRSFVGSIRRAIMGDDILWMRPNGWNLENMLWIADYVSRSNAQYLMFMIHSSELAPHCNPRFTSEEQIEKLYSDIQTVFSYVSNKYRGETVGDFAKSILRKKVLKNRKKRESHGKTMDGCDQAEKESI